MQKRRFTLIELLVVLVIIGILLGIAIPAFEKLTMGSGVDAAARTLSSATSLARQFAISQRQRVAVLMPGDLTSDSSTDMPASLRCKAIGFCIVDSSLEFMSVVPNTKIEYLPVGSVLQQIAGDPSGTAQEVLKVKWTAFGLTGESSCRAVVFKSSGALDHEETRNITIAEGEYTGNGTSGLLIRNTQNKKVLQINGYTGRGSFTP